MSGTIFFPGRSATVDWMKRGGDRAKRGMVAVRKIEVTAGGSHFSISFITRCLVIAAR